MELNSYCKSRNFISEVETDSIAEELGIEIGDVLVSINGQPVADIIEYKYLITDEYIEMVIEKPNGEIWELEIEKEYDERIGMFFTNPLIDKAKSCRNKCMFCFIDQLPKGMRETLYFKDDDSRLSFLQGNFITLTNMSDEDLDRIVRYRISPINISVHATEPDLRVKMLTNPNAALLYERMKKLHEARIEMKCQIVLIPGVNDGEHLERTLDDLAKFHPWVVSVAIVPVGITKHREHLPKLEIFDKAKTLEVFELMDKKQEEFLEKLGTKFAFLSDEFYVVGEREILPEEDYEGFPQIENGVGMLRNFITTLDEGLNNVEHGLNISKSFYMVTGTLAKGFIKDMINRIKDKIKVELDVISVKNKFFGETITVAGLLTGGDIIEEVLKWPKRDAIIIPRAMLKANDTVFLDDLDLSDLEERLSMKVIVAENDAENLVDIIVEEF
jgi:putative radical SAM enzyme (TIGR03279 family)